MRHVQVNHCKVVSCCFNREGKCHSLAIQIGDEHTPACDTFTTGASQCGVQNVSAEVGACKVRECEFNKALICDASGIDVGWKDELPECLTFKHNQ